MKLSLFNPEEFWTLSIQFNDSDKNSILASITQLNDKKIEKFSFKNKAEIDKAMKK